MSIKKVYEAVRDLLGLKPDDHVEIVISEPVSHIETMPPTAMDFQGGRGKPPLPVKKITRVKVVALKAPKKKDPARKLQK